MNRKNTLNNNNIDTTKFFSLTLPEGLKPGSKVTLTITEDGTPVFADEITKAISNNGYVNNNHLFRRWVMAQMFKGLYYYNAKTGKCGFDAWLNDEHGYNYQFKVISDELHALAKMERTGGNDFVIRSSFFTKEIIVKTLDDYMKKLRAYVLDLMYHQRGNYIYIDGYTYQKYEAWDQIYTTLTPMIRRFKYAGTYGKMKDSFDSIMKAMVKLPKDTPKCSEWKSAYKGAGAYYTLQNLIRFHNVRIKIGCVKLSLDHSENVLEAKREETQGYGYKLFAFMKEVIDYNNFNFYERMEQIYK